MKKFSAKSILSSAAFFLCAMTANATVITVSNGVMTVNYNAEGQDRLDNVSEANRKATTKLVIIGNHDGYTTTFQNNKDWAIETLDLSKAILPTQYTFKRLYNLQEIVWPASEFVIPEHAFELSDGDIQNGSVPSLAEVTIPSNCTEVKAHAFGSHTALKTINIEGPSTILRHESFNNVKNVKDVYIKSGEALNLATGECFCEFGAFDFWVTWVQTDFSRLNEAACLHFPKDVEENIKWYCNPNVDVITQKVLNDNYHEACNKSKNGWHEFLVNDNAIVKQELVFRTFSDTKPHRFPKCEKLEDGLKIYYIVGTIEFEGKTKILIEPLNENDDYVLPANTGALIYTKKGFMIYDVPETGESDYEKNLNKISQFTNNRTPRNKVNYLESLQDAPDEIYLTSASRYQGKNFVNMFLDYKRDIDELPVEWGFYTIIPQVYTKAEIGYRAYLNFPVDIVDQHSMFGFNDGQGDVPPALNNGNSKVFDLNIDDNDDITGMYVVVKNNVSNNTESYYNLAGQQISAPAKSLYIHNGKKYMK